MEKNLHLKEDDTVEKFHVNLAYLEKLGYNEIKSDVDKLKKLLYFLICDDKKLDVIYKGDLFMEKVVKEAREIAGFDKVKLYFTEDEVLKYDNEIRYNDGFKKGLEQGILQNKQEMVISLYKNGVTLDIIAKSANLSIDEVKDIIKKNK